MTGSLDGPLAKWSRAQGKLASLKTEVDAVWPPHGVWPARTEPEGPSLEYRFYLGDLPDIDPEWALVVGEILFALRSALDHLAYQLHVRRFRGRVPRTVEGTTQFPIYDARDKWRANFYRVKELSRRDQIALHHLQPYVARNDRWYWHRWALSRLNAWHNWDKHRKLHLVTAAKDSVIIAEPGPAFRTGVYTVHGP